MVDFVPIVVSVPKNIKCLSGVETKVVAVAVGAFANIVARVEFAAVASEFQLNVSPPLMVAINKLPKLSRDQIPGAVTTSPDGALFQAAKDAASVTVAQELCAAAVVPCDPLVKPDSVPESSFAV